MVRRDQEGRFFGARVNCEQVPLLPASVVRDVLEDRFGGACMLLWRDPRDGEIKETADIKPVPPPECFSFVEAVEIIRPSMGVTDLHVFRQPLPRNGGNDVLIECPNCYGLRRAPYGWPADGSRTRSAIRSQWQCRWCAGLRYASEGSVLVVRSRGYLGKILGVGRANRPRSWAPLVLAKES
jgi:hypothetical protein